MSENKTQRKVRRLPELRPGEYRGIAKTLGPSLAYSPSASVEQFLRHVTDEMPIVQPWELGAHIDDAVFACHGLSWAAGWWVDLDTGEATGSVPEKLALIHSEVSEALEADRKGLMDNKLPDRPGIEVELADAVIRIFDLAGALGLDLGGAVVEKLKFNAGRADHHPGNRAKAGGKRY